MDREQADETCLGLLSQIPKRAHFGLSYSDYRELPWGLRDKMIKQVNEWRAEEDRQAKRKR